MEIKFWPLKQGNNCRSVSKKLMNCVKNGTTQELLWVKSMLLHFEAFLSGHGNGYIDDVSPSIFGRANRVRELRRSNDTV